MKKPELPSENDPSFLGRVKLTLQILTGRRGNSIAAPVISSSAVSAAPTADDHNQLRADVVSLQKTLSDLLDRLDG